MPTPTPPPLGLAYSTYSAGVVSWQRERDLLLITLHEPLAARRPPRWPLILATWAALFLLICLLTFNHSPRPDAIRSALLITASLITAHLVILLLGGRSSPRRLLIRVSAHKLLLDEYRPGRFANSNLSVSVEGRAYAADEITSVTAAHGTFRVQTRTRRLAPFSVSGYDPGDLAFAADTIRKVLADGVDAWVRSQSTAAAADAPLQHPH